MGRRSGDQKSTELTQPRPRSGRYTCMRIIETEPARWIVELGGGVELEVQLVGGRAWAFWRFAGELVAEAWVGYG